ncbi:hypothetical protein XF_0937 [Xylella fastidiosa 9a5c]|uniref:Uncharacterized protein n=1 Tax=Xylella fastidiosa (strain 9a5c) TaxID=160492 RepID=Q9PEU1_XYLFA|nr:hypothetical protein XF_0937 [Xylella fastidiosa 9a5c]
MPPKTSFIWIQTQHNDTSFTTDFIDPKLGRPWLDWQKHLDSEHMLLPLALGHDADPGASHCKIIAPPLLKKIHLYCPQVGPHTCVSQQQPHLQTAITTGSNAVQNPAPTWAKMKACTIQVSFTALCSLS